MQYQDTTRYLLSKNKIIMILIISNKIIDESLTAFEILQKKHLLLVMKILPKESHGEIKIVETDFSMWKSK